MFLNMTNRQEKLIELGQEDFIDFLQELVDGGHLENAALGITKQIIAKGINSLKGEQTYVFKRYVLEHFVVDKCKGFSCGGGSIPWSEMYMAMETRMCSYCMHKHEKIMAE